MSTETFYSDTIAKTTHFGHSPEVTTSECTSLHHNMLPLHINPAYITQTYQLTVLLIESHFRSSIDYLSRLRVTIHWRWLFTNRITTFHPNPARPTLLMRATSFFAPFLR